MAYVDCYFPHGGDASAVQIVVVLTSLDEEVVLNVHFHLLARLHKVIVPAVHLVVTALSRCVWRDNTRHKMNI